MRKLAFITLAAVLTGSAAHAQSAPPQRHSDYVQVAQLFGESDEDKKARLQHEQNQDNSIQQLNNRIGDLESTVTRLTGQIEQLDHRLSEANARAERMQKDYDYKLCTMAQQQLGASGNPNDPNALSCGATAAAPAPQSYTPAPAPPIALQPYNPPPPSEGYTPSVTTNIPPPSTPMSEVTNTKPPIHLAPPPSVLGTLPANQANGAPAAIVHPSHPAPPPSGIETGMLPSVDVPSQYENAKKLLAQAQYDEARAAFRTFADSNPQDPRAGPAIYWIGSIDFVQKDYPNASRGFAEALKKYPDSPTAPQSMLKLGQTLLAMKQPKEGCTFLGALPAKYPQADKGVLAQAAAARKDAHCH
jgi:tol-pal system protein YbgF